MQPMSGDATQKSRPILLINPGSPFARKCLIVLAELHFDVEIRVTGGFSSGLPDAQLLEINPLGEVPALRHGDLHIFGSQTICDYLIEAGGLTSLLPSTAMLRAKARMIEQIADDRVDPIHWGLIQARFMSWPSRLTRAALEDGALHDMALLVNWFANQLGQQTWFCGDKFSTADIAVIAHLGEIENRGDWPDNLKAWRDRTMERPAVIAAFQIAAEWRASLTAEDITNFAARSRQLRDTRIEWLLKHGGTTALNEAMADGKHWFSKHPA
jgi:glutathione S-transferase